MRSRSSVLTRVATMLLMAAVTACQKPLEKLPETAPSAAASLPVRVLVIDDAELSNAIERHWGARFEQGVTVRQMAAAELLAPETRRLAADAIIYPSGLLGELAERGWIEPVSDEDLRDGQLDWDDVFEIIRLREVRWGGKTMALPFGSPPWMILYRADVFERLKLSPPATWSDYEALLERLARREALGTLAPAAGEPWSAALEPLGPGWLAQWFIARSAAYSRHPSNFSTFFDYRSMEPLVAGPPFVRAAKELLAAAKHMPSQAASWSPGDMRREFFQGHCAMAVGWPGRADDESAQEAPAAVGFLELPGSRDAYDFRTARWESRGDESARRVTVLADSGRFGSVTRESRQARAAAKMLVWLSSELSATVSSESKHTMFFRQSHLDRAGLWIDRRIDEAGAKAYGEVVQQALRRPAWLDPLRIPGRALYLAELDRALRASLAGELPVDESLRRVAERWNKITDELGREGQIQAHRRSIGIGIEE